MCGRYALHSLIGDLRRHFGLFDELDFRPRYNIAPSLSVPIVRQGNAGKELTLCRWGFIPAWSKTLPRNQPINARAETVADKPFFRGAFRRRRCLVPANGFYEWKRAGKEKQPYYFRLKGADLLAFAGVWDRWQGGEQPVDTFAIITTGANDIMLPIHDRMPVILAPGQYNRWIDAGDAGVLVPYAGEMDCYPISRSVNSPAHEGRELIEPLFA